VIQTEQHADIGLEAIRDAAERIADVAHRTPILTNRTLDRVAGRKLFFKAENLQRIGAFKIRGAANFVAQLSDEEAALGVVTHSSGNHAQAVALAAKRQEVRAQIVMPSGSAQVKLDAVRGYGAEVVLCEPNYASRVSTARDLLAESGGVFVSPFDHPYIIAGQATASLEFWQDLEDLDAIVVPVGGGGLAAGTCIATRALAPRARIFAAEPLGADDTARSFATGERQSQDAPNTIADGLRGGVGELTWPILQAHLDRVITVTENEIISAMRLFWERTKYVIEPSAAVAVAAVLTEEFRGLSGIGRVGIILSGGNVDLGRLPWT